MKKSIYFLILTLLSFTPINYIIATSGNFMHRNSSNQIFYFSGSSDSNGQMAWKQIDGAAKDIAITSDGQMICVGTNDAIYYSSGIDANGKPNWKKQNGTAATHVAAAGDKFLHRNSANNMYYFSGKPDANGQMAWKKIDGAAKSIAVASDGQMMHVGMDNAIYYSSGLDSNGKPNWKKQNGTAATHVAAAGDKFLHRNSANNMYYFSGKPDSNGQMAWKQIDGAAKSIAVTSDGQMICVGTDDAIYYSSGLDSNGKPNWKKQNGTAATHVAAAEVIDDAIDNSVFTYNPMAGIPGAAFTNENWKTNTPGNFVITFDANTQNNIYVHLYAYKVTQSYVSWQQWGYYYHVKIDPNQTDILCFNGETNKLTLTPNKSLKVTMGVKESWWISLKDKKTLTVGKGTYPNGITASWTIPDGFIIAPTYFGFGGAGAPTYFENIKITTLEQQILSAEGGRFIHRNSANNMYYFSGKPDSNGQMAWKQIDGAAKDIAITADGQMICVGTNDAIYYSSGIDANGKPNWKKQNGTAATHVAARGNKFMHRNSANEMFYFSGKADSNGQMAWKPIEGRAKSIAISSDGQMLCVGMDNAIYYSSGVDANGKANWKGQPGTAATHVAIGGSTKFMHRNASSNMYYFSGKPDVNGQMAWKQIEGQAKSIALVGDGQMMHVGMDDAIYYSSGLDANGKPNWKKQNGTAATHVAAAGLKTPLAKVVETGNIKIGDTVKIESAEKPGYFLADDGSGKSTISKTGNIEWVIDRQGETGKSLTSGTFPKLKNKATGKYLGGTAAGTPLPMGTTNYGSGEFWTPVDLSSNDATNINTLITTFHATKYPEQYTYVLYRGLAGNGDGNIFTTQAGYATVGKVPNINTVVNYDKMVAFVSNGGYILTNVPGYTKAVDNIAKWYIRSPSGEITPPETTAQTYTFNPKTEGIGKVKYHTEWKAAENNISVTFKAKTTADIYVQFAPEINSTKGEDCLILNIGANANKKTWLRNGFSDNKRVYTPVLTTSQTITDNNTQITDSIPPEGAIFNITLYGNIITYKKNDVEIGTWKILDPTKKFVYIALGGYNSVVEYSDIKVQNAQTSSDFPSTYTCITPKAADIDEITLGSKDGKIELWAIDVNNKVYRFNEFAGAPYNMPSATIDPWEIQTLKDETGAIIAGFNSICATCDGNLFAIRSDDKTAVKYDFTKKQWIRMAITNAKTIKLENIAASKDTEIFATSEDDIIYQLKNKAWTKISTGSFVAAGIGTDNKSIVIGLSTTGTPYRYLNKKWYLMGKDTQLNKVTIGNQNYILGVNNNNQLVQWNSKAKTWNLVAGKTEKSIESVDDIAAIPSGTTVALDKFGNTWHKGSDAVKVSTSGVTTTKSTATTVTKAVATKKVSTAAKKKTVKKVSPKKATKTLKAKKATKKKATKKRTITRKTTTKKTRTK